MNRSVACGTLLWEKNIDCACTVSFWRLVYLVIAEHVLHNLMHSPAGNRTRVARVTGGNTHHYTTEDLKLIIFLKNFGSQICPLLNKTMVNIILSSPAGNRTRVARVTGGNTHHYTTEDDVFIFIEKVK
ncbi:hypothetical protein T06_11428 [Trichinella sp. T6]|nr:hypothetical protein T06_11428 [Trichinella sp. T6]